MAKLLPLNRQLEFLIFFRVNLLNSDELIVGQIDRCLVLRCDKNYKEQHFKWYDYLLLEVFYRLSLSLNDLFLCCPNNLFLKASCRINLLPKTSVE